MAYEEYNKMFLKCQDTGPYKLYAYDVKGSRNLRDPNLVTNLYKLILLVMAKIRELETERKILYDKDDLIYYGSNIPCIDGNIREPMLVGDAIAFTVYRDSITDDVVDKIFEESKQELGINYEFHKANGYYETNNWGEGNKKYFRGYCFALLTEMHKPGNSKVLRKIKR
ncbi:MAG: hypothetical protein PHD10_05040 [Bacilli bacterium]|nr:hypothetical protein [Bacilli bacterium]MDD4608473.1 hypothetical protein [Bacilli bacterium]